jgi:alpha-tubulin suppressor-like RCC1 family protein
VGTVRGLRIWVALGVLMGSAGVVIATPMAAGAAPAPLSSIAQIATGGETVCARLDSGTARCWGSDDNGSTGTGGAGTCPAGAPSAPCTSTPVEVVNAAGLLTNVVQISVGHSHACALIGDGTAWCWGDNAKGELAHPAVAASGIAVTVQNGSNTGPLTGIAEIAAGNESTCARMTDATARCWGANDSGQLGNGTTSASQPLPVVVENSAGTASLTGIADVQTNFQSSCALLTDHTARCWGANLLGQLGNNDLTFTNASLPVVVKRSDGNTLFGIAQISVGDGSHVCARLTSGGADCWGTNANGELGIGNTTGPQTCFGDGCSVSPVPVRNGLDTADLAGVVDIRAGGLQVCAALADHTVRCWGHNSNGEIGDGAGSVGSDRTLPVKVQAVGGGGVLGNVSTLATGATASCARLVDETAVCWGANIRAQMANGAVAATQPTPVTVMDGGATFTDPPDQPTAANAVAGDHHIAVSWAASAHANGAAISGYTVTRTPGGQTRAVSAATTSTDWTGLTNGVTYTITVHATNAKGNSPESAPVTAIPDDGLPPVPAISAPGGVVRLALGVPVVWSATDDGGIAHYDVRRRAAPWNGALAAFLPYLSATTATSATYRGSYGHTYCFGVRAQDRAGHVSAYTTTPRCNAIPLRSDQFTHGASWTKAVNAAYFGGFAFKATAHGAVLTRTSIVAKKLYLVATKCPSCGTVQVKWKGNVVANVNLANAATLRKQVISLAAFASAQSGTLTITLTSPTGKAAIVEGLAVVNGE